MGLAHRRSTSRRGRAFSLSRATRHAKARGQAGALEEAARHAGLALPGAVQEPNGEAVKPGDIFSPAPGASAEVLKGSLDGPFLVALVTLAPGAEWPREAHAEHVEAVLVIAGEIRVAVEGELCGLFPDAGAFHIRPGELHIIWNGTAGEAVYVSTLRRVNS